MQPITYPQLRLEMQKQLEEAQKGSSKQVFSNLNSALGQYLAEMAIPTEAAVGVELRTSQTAATYILFVSRKSGLKNQPWQSLNRRVEALTAKHVMNCPGVGPHVIRHIVATAIVKITGEYSTAALVLHDKEETVKKAYSHLCSEDGHARYRGLFPEVFKGE